MSAIVALHSTEAQTCTVACTHKVLDSFARLLQYSTPCINLGTGTFAGNVYKDPLHQCICQINTTFSQPAAHFPAVKAHKVSRALRLTVWEQSCMLSAIATIYRFAAKWISSLQCLVAISTLRSFHVAVQQL